MGTLAGRDGEQAVGQLQQPIGGLALSRLKGGNQGIGSAVHEFVAPDGGFGGGLAADEFVEDGAKAVEVGVGALLPFGAVLLGRGVAGTDDGAEAAAVFTQGMAGGAKVDEQRAALLSEEDVAGFDVAVQQSRLVNLLQAVEQRGEEGEDFVLVEAAALEPLAQGLAFFEVHDDIRRSVGFEVVNDANDVGVFELGEGLGFVEVFSQAVVVVGLALAVGDDAQGAGVAHP